MRCACVGRCSCRFGELKLHHWQPERNPEEDLREVLAHADQVAHVLSLYHSSSPVLTRYLALRKRFPEAETDA